MFIRVERHPWGDSWCTISLPKGHNANIPSLTVWSPKGIPMIVINNPILAMKYSTATKIPPNSNQMIFPKIFMFQTEKSIAIDQNYEKFVYLKWLNFKYALK